MIRDILLGQKRELDAKKGQLYIKRESEIKSLQKNIIKVVTGPRRAGKSFFIMNSMKDNFGYANFDDEYLTQEINYDEIVAAIDNG